MTAPDVLAHIRSVAKAIDLIAPVKFGMIVGLVDGVQVSVRERVTDYATTHTGCVEVSVEGISSYRSKWDAVRRQSYLEKRPGSGLNIQKIRNRIAYVSRKRAALEKLKHSNETLSKRAAVHARAARAALGDCVKASTFDGVLTVELRGTMEQLRPVVELFEKIKGKT